MFWLRTCWPSSGRGAVAYVNFNRNPSIKRPLLGLSNRSIFNDVEGIACVCIYRAVGSSYVVYKHGLVDDNIARVASLWKSKEPIRNLNQKDSSVKRCITEQQKPNLLKWGFGQRAWGNSQGTCALKTYGLVSLIIREGWQQLHCNFQLAFTLLTSRLCIQFLHIVFRGSGIHASRETSWNLAR